MRSFKLDSLGQWQLGTVVDCAKKGKKKNLRIVNLMYCKLTHFFPCSIVNSNMNCEIKGQYYNTIEINWTLQHKTSYLLHRSLKSRETKQYLS